MLSSYLPDVRTVNVNHRASWQSAVTYYFRKSFKKRYGKNLWLSFLTLGYFPYKKYKQAKQTVYQALAARKLFYFKILQDRIEEVREEQHTIDPRQVINAVFMKVQTEKVDEEEGALEFKAVYYPSEILVFITNPVRDRRVVRFRRPRREGVNYIRMWNEIKKRAKVNQYRQIQSINFSNKTLKEEYCLTSQGIHDRLSRTEVFRKSPALLTKFKELSRAFQEIVVAYYDFDDFKESNPSLYHLLELLSKTSKKDIDVLQTYLKSRYLPRDLPLENRRQLIRLGNQQDVLYNMSKELKFEICALILDQYQWSFLLSIQEVSEVTLGLLDWAFEEAPSEIHPPPSFIDKIIAGIWDEVKDHPDDFPILSEKIHEEVEYQIMTVDFARELNREWPSICLKEEGNLFSQKEKTESLSFDELLQVYREMKRLADKDDVLFRLLQQSLSQVGKNAFQAAIEEGVMKLLGEKSEYFIPILTNSSITIEKRKEDEVEICYCFEQVIRKKGEVLHPFEKEKYMIITQPLCKKEGKWCSPQPQVKMAIKNE